MIKYESPVLVFLCFLWVCPLLALHNDSNIQLLVNGQTVFDEITNLMSVAEGRVNVTEMRLPEDTPVADMALSEIDFPVDSLVAGIIRRGQVIVPRGDSRLQVGDRLVLITRPENQEVVLALLTGEKAL